MHVGDAVAARAIEEEPTLGGELREVAVLFIDLIGSTSLSQTHPPDRIVALLNDFFACVVSTAELHDGFVNKFEGDAALVVFGAPLPHDGASGAALRTARSLSVPTSSSTVDSTRASGSHTASAWLAMSVRRIASNTPSSAIR
ncbi:adenylate/guanylate cyclase domain-containing protein [Gordonia rubripertincta]|uniref:Adenylate/guanylate cyclase domain-containing protein n=1 Tax=Gordonia rubripertincta TaxID=36822 RepID=A0AAW6RG77_GORRU|nr:adenylate/guanylate cyclase domain-containing protein [Gordonia rubripertincta]MDG6783767.1 adenylate/guanylate cyclase domain-containing protein [Gordonia rubripertincta]